MTEIFTAKHFYKKHESDLCAVYWKFHLFAKNIEITLERKAKIQRTQSCREIAGLKVTLTFLLIWFALHTLYTFIQHLYNVYKYITQERTIISSI